MSKAKKPETTETKAQAPGPAPEVDVSGIGEKAAPEPAVEPVAPAPEPAVEPVAPAPEPAPEVAPEPVAPAVEPGLWVEPGAPELPWGRPRPEELEGFVAYVLALEPASVRLRVRTADQLSNGIYGRSRSNGIYQSGLWVTPSGVDVDVAHVRALSAGHLAGLLRNEAFEFQFAE